MNMTGKILLSAAAVVAFSSSAMAADLMVPAAPAPAVVAPSTNWDGAYIGATLGYGWGFADHTSGPGTNDISTSGLFVGGQVGYNFSLSDNIVAGIQGDLNWSNEQGSIPAFGTTTQRINWDGAVMGRLGMSFDTILPYVEAGVAFANATRSNSGPTSTTNTQTGWAVGAGVEFMLADNLSANAEYRYSDYGSAVYNTGGTPPTIHLTDSTVRFGLNYHF